MTVRPEALPFGEAIDFLRQKVNLPTEKWTDLERGQHARAFTVAGATKDALLADFRQSVDRAIAEGRTLADFRKDFDRIVAAHGWSYKGGRNWRSRVIYDTNMRMAHAAGRWAQIQAVKADRPYLRYVAILDADTRADHRGWHGTIAHADDVWWHTHYPPCGWRCRCTVQVLGAGQLKAYGVMPDNLPPTPPVVINPATGTPVGIDKGFDYNVGRASIGSRMAEAEYRQYQEMGSAAWRDMPGPPPPLRDPVPFDPVPDTSGPSVLTREDMVDAVSRLFGGAETSVQLPDGSRVLIDADWLGGHIMKNPQRAQFLPLYKAALTDPYEVWQIFQEHVATGQVRLEKRIIRGFSLGSSDKYLLAAFQTRGGHLVSWTLFPTSRRADIDKRRRGRLVFGR
jgi:SPP1 gp7 family putative phage head morphogenesis protein